MRSPEPPTQVSPDRHLTASIVKGTAFGIVSRGTQIGTRLIMVPVVISHLGLGGYGIWSIILATAAYMRFGNAGIKSAFQKYVAEATATGNFERANDLVSTGAICMLAVSAIGLVPLALFSHRLAELVGVPAGYLGAAASSIMILGCIYTVSNFGSAFESIVMGAQRIDLTKIYITLLSVLEAAGIIILLHFGYDLVAMTLVMGASELIYIACCYFASHRVVPSMRVGIAHFRRSAFSELIRYGASYQLVNVLELIYASILPIACLKCFGPEAAGVYAIAARVVNSALIGQNALVLPILSGGALIFASGSTERIKEFISKSYRVTLAVALPPIGFVCAFGTVFVFVWTGEVGPRFATAIWLTAIAGLLQALSLLQLILYRASGRALMDGVSRALRIGVIIGVALFAKTVGFKGLLVGIVAAELAGAIVMFLAVATSFPAFNAKVLTRDALKMCAATLIIVGVGAAAGMLPVPPGMAERLMAVAKLAEIALGCVVAGLPALLITRSISAEEIRAAWNGLSPRRAALAGMSR